FAVRRVVGRRRGRADGALPARAEGDRQLGGLDVVDLERDVLDAPALADQPAGGVLDAVAVAGRVDQQVRGQCGQAGGDLPDVQVVDVGHLVERGQRPADLP